MIKPYAQSPSDAIPGLVGSATVRTRVLAIVALLAVAAVGCSSGSGGTTTTTTAKTAVPKAELRDATCSFRPAIAGAVCHTLVVPADRTDPSLGTMTLPVVVLKANGPSPAADAVVSPSGGPGYAGLPDASFYVDTTLRKNHDIVLYDQRGMGGAKPSLDCPEREKVFIANLAVADPMDKEVARVRSRDGRVQGAAREGRHRPRPVQHADQRRRSPRPAHRARL